VSFQHGLDEVAQRHKRRAGIVAELAEHRLTLLEAAARFRTLNAEMPDHVQQVVRKAYQEYPEPERDCRFVIDYLDHHLLGDSATRQVVTGRLENELCDLIHTGSLSAEAEGANAAVR